MIFNRRYVPYAIVFFITFIALIWRPFLIGFYGDDFSHAIADTFDQALFYGRQERFFYFFPIAIPRYFFGYDHISWGWYAITSAGLTAMALYSLFVAILSRLPETKKYATPAAMASAILYIFMPWSLTPVLWNTALSQLFMVALLALAGTVLFSRLSLPVKAILFVILFSVSSLIYETIWGAWLPLILIKLAIDAPVQRRETFVIAAAAIFAQCGLFANYLFSYGMEGRVMAGGGFTLHNKLALLVENIFVRFPFEVLSSMGVMGLVAIPFLLFISYWVFKRRSELTSPAFWLVVVSCMLGILGGIVVVTLGNYRVSATTDDARFLSSVSLWLSLLVALVASLMLSQGSNRARVAGYVVYALIVLAFFVRSNDWVQGYFFQRQVINAVPVEQIAALVDGPEIAAMQSPENVLKPILLVEYDTPLHLFHGWANEQATAFITQKIKDQTGKDLLGVPLDGRMWKTVLDGARLYQPRCANLEELLGDYVVPSNVIYWRIKTGEVRKVASPFSTGCTRELHRFEVLGELLYPFMGNPRRP